MEDLSRFCCQNQDCPDYGRRGHGNLTVCGRYGKAQQHGCSTAAPARPASPSARARPCSARTCPRRRPSRSWTPGRGLRRPATARLVGCTATRSCATAAWPASTPGDSTTSSWLFPPRTREVQFDEKWSFVGKKQEHCDPDDPADAQQGRLVGPRRLRPRAPAGRVRRARGADAESAEEVVAESKRRTGGRAMNLMTSDEYPAYKEAILQAYGAEATTTPTGRASRRMAPEKVPPPGLSYATVHKPRRLGRVVEILVASDLRDGRRWPRRCGGRRSAGGSTCRSWSGRTRPTGTATPGRCGRPTGSRRIGRCMRR